MDNLNEDIISGFSDYNSCRFEGFTERNLVDFLNILDNIQKTEKYEKMSKLYEALQSHLLATNDAHIFSLSEMKDDVIGTLYRLFRKHGYKGSVKDMLFAVVKTIEVGDDNDVAAGMSKEKAETAVAFNKVLVEHYNKDYAHRNISDSITPSICVNRYPYLIIDNNSDKTINIYNIDNLLNCGIILFEYWFNHKPNQGELFRIGFKQGSLIFTATTSGIDVSLNSNVVLHLAYPDNLKINKYLFSFDKNGITLRDEINSIHNSNTVLSDGNNIVLPTNVLPIGGGSRSRSDGINKIYVYDYNLSDEEKTYLLN